MFTMDKKNNSQTWVGNMYQRFEAVCQEVDDFVNKDTVKYVENHMQTVGKSVKKFYSGVVQDILPPLVDPVKHVAKSIPSKQIDLVGTHTSSIVGIKENTVDSNTNKSEEDPLVPTEKCHKPSTSGLYHSEQISCATGGYPVGEADANLYFQQEGDNLINKTSGKVLEVHLNSDTRSQENFMVEQSLCKDVSSPEHRNYSEALINSRCIDEKCNDDHPAKISHESSENHLDDRSFEEEGIICNIISESDASVFGHADWGIENIVDLNLGIDKKIEGEPSPSENVNIAVHKALRTAPFVEEKFENVPMETLVNGLGIGYSQEEKTLHNRVVDEFECDSNTSTAQRSSELESSIIYNGLGIGYSQEEKTLHNGVVDEFECDSNTSTAQRSSELESSIVYSENKEEKACHIFAGGFVPAKVYDSSTSSFRNSLVEPDTIYCNPTESMGCFSVSSHGLSSSKSLAALGCDNNNDSTRPAFSNYALSDDTTRTDEAVSGTGLCRSEHDRYCKLAQFEASVSCSKIGVEDSSRVDVEDLNMDTIDLSDKKQLADSCVIVEGEELYAFSCRSRRSKSYKKIIQDAFSSRKRLTKEYKQLAIWYGDIDAEFSQPTEERTLKPPLQDSRDSEWELV